MSGSWAGNLVSARSTSAPFDAIGQKMMSLNQSETKVGTGHSNDPMNTCDPLGVPRNLVFETRGVAFATMPRQDCDIAPVPEGMALRLDGREARTAQEIRHQGRSAVTLVRILSGALGRGLHPGDRYRRQQRPTWVDKAGYPHSVNAQIQERYTRVDHNHMETIVTVDDPTVFTKSFALSTNDYQWIPNQEAEEQICVPSEMIRCMSLISTPSFNKGSESK